MISIFPRTALELVNIKDDAQVAAYHFDAVTEYKLDAKTRYTRYPIEYGVDIQDHAYNEPTKLVVYGYMGSTTLRMSVNQLPGLGASAVVGGINDPVVSAVAGIAGAAYEAGTRETRGGTTLMFLERLKSKFIRFDVQTDLTLIPSLKIDNIHVPVKPETENGLEFVVEMSQLFVVGDESPSALQFDVDDVSKIDAATLQNAAMVDRGRVSLV